MLSCNPLDAILSKESGIEHVTEWRAPPAIGRIDTLLTGIDKVDLPASNYEQT